MKLENKSISQLKKELDRVFSIFIRTKYADDTGMVSCYTCGKVDSWQNMQNSHFISRRHNSTRWDINNCRPACVKCNMFNQGEQYKFGKRLEKEIGNKAVSELWIRSKQPFKLNKSILIYSIIVYTEKTNNK